MKKEKTWATLKVKGLPWDECPQKYIGEMLWSDAVAWAKIQDTSEVRLTTTYGYNGQGHYIQTNKGG